MVHTRASSGLAFLATLSCSIALSACSRPDQNTGQPPGSGGAGGASTTSSSATTDPTSGSGGQGGAGQGGAGQGGSQAQGPCDYPHDNAVPVTDANGLTAALEAAMPGTLIELAPA